MEKKQSRASELATRVVACIENWPADSKRRPEFARILGSLLRQDHVPHLDNHQFGMLVAEVQREAMNMDDKEKREIVYPTLPSFVQKRYDRAAKRRPSRRRKLPNSLKIHMPLYRPEIDTSPEWGYDYGDQNKGYIHNPDSPYLEEAPSS